MRKPQISEKISDQVLGEISDKASGRKSGQKLDLNWGERPEKISNLPLAASKSPSIPFSSPPRADGSVASTGSSDLDSLIASQLPIAEIWPVAQLWSVACYWSSMLQSTNLAATTAMTETLATTVKALTNTVSSTGFTRVELETPFNTSVWCRVMNEVSATAFTPFHWGDAWSPDWSKTIAPLWPAAFPSGLQPITATMMDALTLPVDPSIFAAYRTAGGHATAQIIVLPALNSDFNFDLSNLIIAVSRQFNETIADVARLNLDVAHAFQLFSSGPTTPTKATSVSSLAQLPPWMFFHA
jgi:hypothetical protein